MLDAALRYAASGRYVFPCLPLAKDPATLRGFKAATTNPDKTRGWWGRNPNLNVAISTGPSRLLVVDLDVKDGVDGFANWCELGSKHGSWDDAQTLVVVTPTGGLHWYYQLEPDCRVSSSTGKLAPGVDVKASGGYVLAPPSRREEGCYRVDSDTVRVAGRVDPPPPPAWLLGLLRTEQRRVAERISAGLPSDRYGQTALNRELIDLGKAPNGSRNDRLNQAAFNLGQLVAVGSLDGNTVIERLTATATRIGLDPDEIRRTINSGLKAGIANPRGK